MSDFDDTNEREIQKTLNKKIKQMQMRKKQTWGANFGMIASLGGVMVMPILLGIWLGGYLDEVYPIGFSWRLILLFVGFVWGMANGYFWIKIEEEKISRKEKRLQKELQNGEDK